MPCWRAGRNDTLPTWRRSAAFGLEHLSLSGHSWSSGLAVLYAAAYPARVRRLLLVAPLPPARAPFFAERLAAVAQRDSALRAGLGWGADEVPAGADAVAQCRRKRASGNRRPSGAPLHRRAIGTFGRASPPSGSPRWSSKECSLPCRWMLRASGGAATQRTLAAQVQVGKFVGV